MIGRAIDEAAAACCKVTDNSSVSIGSLAMRRMGYERMMIGVKANEREKEEITLKKD